MHKNEVIIEPMLMIGELMCYYGVLLSWKHCNISLIVSIY